MVCPKCEYDTTKTTHQQTIGGQLYDKDGHPTYHLVRGMNEQMVLNRLNGCCPSCGFKIQDGPLPRP